MRVAVFGEESAGVQLLEALARSRHEVVTVVTSPPADDGAPAPLWTAAERLGHVPVPAARIREDGFAAELAKSGVDLILNVHSLVILTGPVLRVAPLGIYNLHPGPLPRYAGLNAPSWAIFHGETMHGVTVHKVEAEIDTGPIAYQECFPIGPDETALRLSVRCVQVGLVLLERLVESLAADPRSVALVPQDLSRRTYYGRRVPRRGVVDWKETARRVHDFVRASDFHPFRSPWGVPRTRLDGLELLVGRIALTAERCDAPPGTVCVDGSGRSLVATADEWLWIRRLALAGKAAEKLRPEEILSTGDRLV